MSGPTILDNISGPAVLSKLSTVILDCDGVLWQGSDVVPNAIEVPANWPNLAWSAVCNATCVSPMFMMARKEHMQRQMRLLSTRLPKTARVTLFQNC
jgi:hypothetical protein